MTVVVIFLSLLLAEISDVGMSLLFGFAIFSASWPVGEQGAMKYCWTIILSA